MIGASQNSHSCSTAHDLPLDVERCAEGAPPPCDGSARAITATGSGVTEAPWQSAGANVRHVSDRGLEQHHYLRLSQRMIVTLSVPYASAITSRVSPASRH